MSLLSQSLLLRYPPSIQSALLNDDDFTQRLGLDTVRVFTFGNSVTVSDEQLFTAVRTAFCKSEGSTFEDRKGRKVRIYVHEDSVEMAVLGTQLPPISVPEFILLSPKPEDRVQKIETIIQSCGPTAPNFAVYLKAAETRELFNAEVSEILTELHQGVGINLARAADAFRQRRAAVEDLVPSQLSFFERFCGPNPGSSDIETYLANILPEQRKGLLNRDLAAGLDICLVGALRHDLCPGRWLESVSDDDVWQVLEKAQFLPDPYSLLGALDLALVRRHDKRFHDLAKDLLATLSADSITDNDGNDVYELMPVFAQLTLQRINMMEGGVQFAPFWKRMCAWMHGGMLARLSRKSGLDPKGLEQWIQRLITQAGVVANILDLRREPMFSALMVTKASLRGEVLGRLAQLHEQYSKSTEPLPDFQAVEDAWLRAQVKQMPLMCVSPGPLEGTKRPKITTTEKFPALSKEHILNELEANPVGSVWSWLAQLAQTSRLDEDILAAGRDAVRHALIPDDVSPRYVGLSDALLVAISTPDIELRDVIAERLVGLADRIASDEDGAWLAQTIVLASVALQSDVEWENWLAKMLFETAARLPIKKECLLAFISTLEAIETVVPSRAGITAKARAIATAGL